MMKKLSPTKLIQTHITYSKNKLNASTHRFRALLANTKHKTNLLTLSEHNLCTSTTTTTFISSSTANLLREDTAKLLFNKSAKPANSDQYTLEQMYNDNSLYASQQSQHHTMTDISNTNLTLNSTSSNASSNNYYINSVSILKLDQEIHFKLAQLKQIAYET